MIRASLLLASFFMVAGCTGFPDLSRFVDAGTPAPSTTASAEPTAAPSEATAPAVPQPSATTTATVASKPTGPAPRADGRCAICQKDGVSDPFQWTGILWKGDVAKISDEVETIMLDAPAPLFECASQLRTKSGEMLPFYAAEVIRVEGKKVTFNPSGKADKKRCLSLAFGKTAWPEGDYALLINISWNARGPYVAPVAQDALANTFTKRTVWGAPGSGDKRMVGKTPIENVSVADLLPGAKKSVVGVSPPIPRAPEQAFFSGSWAYYAAGQPMGLVWACDIGKAKISGPYCEHLLEELVTP